MSETDTTQSATSFLDGIFGLAPGQQPAPVETAPPDE